MTMNGVIYRFEGFRLDVGDRQLWHVDRPVDLNGRYFDALLLLLRENGQLVEKERFFDEVWKDVIVSDSALTQCIKEIRKQLGDDAVKPRFVQTVPKYGYRFIGAVEVLGPDAQPQEPLAASAATEVSPTIPQQRPRTPLHRAILEAVAGTLGGGVAGLVGGLFYGLLLANASGGGNVGTASTLVVFLSLGVVIGAVGGFGVSFGMAAAGLVAHHKKTWVILGGALGGLFIGGLANLLGVDAFNLLLGRTPVGMTGALEGAVLGAALALGAQLGGGSNASSPWRPVIGAGFVGAMTGVLIPLAGGKLFAGSLQLLVDSFTSSRLRLDRLGVMLGDPGFGHVAQAFLGGIEVLLFGICVIGGFVLAQKGDHWRSLRLLPRL